MTSGSTAAPQVYPLKRGWRIFLQLGALGGLALFGAPLVLWVKDQPVWTPWIIAVAFLSVFTACMVAAWVARMGRYAIEIHPDRVVYRGGWARQELRIEDIAGYRILPTQYVHTLLLVPARKGLRRISTALCYERRDEMLAWFAEHVVNLDEQEMIDEIVDIATDPHLGATEEERMARLARAKRCTGVLNVIGAGATMWAFFYPHPYEAAIWTLIVLPVLALATVVFFRGLVRLDGKPKSAYPNVEAAMVTPPVMLFLRAFLDWQLLSWSGTWPTVAALSVVALGVLLGCAKDARRKWALVGAIMCAPLYAFGAVVFLNCRYDSSSPVVHRCQVVDRHISSGKNVSYHLELAPFVDGASKREISVPRQVYDRVAAGDMVRVGVFQGRLGIPWFLVRAE